MTETHTPTEAELDEVVTDDSWSGQFTERMMGSAPVPSRMLVRGHGARVEDSAGRVYLDFLAGIAVNSLGHAHPTVLAAINDQASRVIHVSGYFTSQPQLALAQRIRRLTGAGDAGRVYFCNSGAEAIEAAVKLARLTGRREILTLENSFHGRTMGALSLSGKPAIQAPFEPLVPGVRHIGSSIDDLAAALTPDTAALVVEPIKGEAGVLPLPEGYLRAARELTSANGTLLILDEIQTGVGRTGEWFAYQHEGIVPDAIAIAKGMGGGIPIGALVTFGGASELFTVGQHGSTYGGNPLATAVSLAVLGEIESAGLVENARVRGEQLTQAIKAIGSPHIVGVRGAGLLLGVALAEPHAAELATAMLAEGVIVNAANAETIRLAPPLIIGDADVDEFVERLTAALAHLD